MLKKAAAFQRYLTENNQNSFTVEEVKHSPDQLTLFRSSIHVEGQDLPLVILFDTSIFTVIRVQVVPQALNKTNGGSLLSLINSETAKYKLFRFYCAADGSLMMEICHTAEDPEAEINGDTFYLFFDMIIHYLDDAYRHIMKAVYR